MSAVGATGGVRQCRAIVADDRSGGVETMPEGLSLLHHRRPRPASGQLQANFGEPTVDMPRVVSGDSASKPRGSKPQPASHEGRTITSAR